MKILGKTSFLVKFNPEASRAHGPSGIWVCRNKHEIRTLFFLHLIEKLYLSFKIFKLRIWWNNIKTFSRQINKRFDFFRYLKKRLFFKIISSRFELDLKCVFILVPREKIGARYKLKIRSEFCKCIFIYSTFQGLNLSLKPWLYFSEYRKSRRAPIPELSMVLENSEFFDHGDSFFSSIYDISTRLK